MWLYDVKKDGAICGDQGAREFKTEKEAIKDAHDYISNGLMNEYNKQFDDFVIETYEAI